VATNSTRIPKVTIPGSDQATELTAYDEGMLPGRFGPAKQCARKALLQLGRAYGAQRMVSRSRRGSTNVIENGAGSKCDPILGEPA